jgi:branched-chain amino acid aminotransferase
MFEVLMVRSNGHILEGLTSNFFAVHAGVLRTAGEGTLEGVARSIDLEIAEGPLPVMLRSVSRMDVPALSEAFVTSSSREALPMVVVDRSPLVRAGQSW